MGYGFNGPNGLSASAAVTKQYALDVAKAPDGWVSRFGGEHGADPVVAGALGGHASVAERSHPGAGSRVRAPGTSSEAIKTQILIAWI